MDIDVNSVNSVIRELQKQIVMLSMRAAEFSALAESRAARIEELGSQLAEARKVQREESPS